MKKPILIALFAVIFMACSNQSNQKKETVDQPQPVTMSVDELYNSAAQLEGKEIVVKGTVMHVCKEGGARCFIMGSNEDVNIRVEAGEKIGAFTQEQMGSELEIKGVLKAVRTAADAHNPNHGEEAQAHNEDTVAAQAHKIIAEAQEAADVVYFIEGISVKEL